MSFQSAFTSLLSSVSTIKTNLKSPVSVAAREAQANVENYQNIEAALTAPTSLGAPINQLDPKLQALITEQLKKGAHDGK